MRADTGDLLQGTLAILILKALLGGPAHGYGIARWVEGTTDDVLRIEEGSLYPALRRLEDNGWVTSEWDSPRTTGVHASIPSRGRDEPTCVRKRPCGSATRARSLRSSGRHLRCHEPGAQLASLSPFLGA